MTEKQLLEQLNKLQSVQPSADFKATNRRLLLAQITQGEDMISLGVWARFNIAMSRLFQPYAVAAMIVLFFAASGIWGSRLSHQAQPGDSLYLAKRLAERTKMLVAVDNKAKTKLNLEFAVNRAAEINLLQQTDSQTSEASAENLKSEFKKEISQVKDRLVKFNIDKPVASSSQGDDFVSAGSVKDDSRIDVSVPAKPVASSTTNDKGIGEVLEEAQELFDNGDYEQVVDKLGEINELIDQAQ